jgi:hypothetical protein
MSSYYIQKNFLSEKYCNYLIDMFTNNEKYYGKHHNMTKFIELDYFMHLDPIKKLYGKLSRHCINNLNKDSFINFTQIVKWRSGSYQEKHIDFDYHPYTSIIYLNDNFDGGETVVGSKKITPERGKILSFTGNKIIHEVFEVKNGTRYTVPVWYKCENF